jgi:hypothetical protein
MWVPADLWVVEPTLAPEQSEVKQQAIAFGGSWSVRFCLGIHECKLVHSGTRCP